MSERSPSVPSRPGPVAIELAALAVGLAWMALELALSFGSGRVLVPSQLVARMFHLLPWQLALFAGIGVAVVVVARVRPLAWGQVVWWIAGLGSFAFLGEALLEGLLRSPPRAALALGVLAVVLTLVAWATLAVSRRLRGRAARAFLPAVWAGYSLFFLAWMQHAMSSIRIWEPGLRGLWQNVDPVQWVVALAGAVLVGAVAALGPARAPWLGAALLLVAPGPRLGGASGAPGGDAKRPDVLVLLIDTLRFDHIGVDVGRDGLTPALDAVAAESVRFEKSISPGNFTKLAVPGILTSLPYRVVRSPLPDAATTLAEHLQRAGWATYGISANPYVTGPFGYGQGFDRFLDPSSVNEFLVEGLLQALGMTLPGPAYRAGLVNSGLYYAPADVLRRRALEFFADSPTPTFVYLQTMDPHGPYLPPHRYLPDDYGYGDFESYYDFDALKGRGVLQTPGYAPKLRNLRQRYDGEVRFTDEEVGKLVAGLRASGRWDEMLVLVLSDHGEAFGEKDWAGHSGRNVSNTLVHVPFLLKPPRSWGIAPRAEPTPVSTLDVVPTLLSLLGLPPADPTFGRDLAPLLRRQAEPGERTLVSFGYGDGTDIYTAVRWPWKLDLELDRESDEPIEHDLYDLRSDPGELRDVSAAHDDVTRALSQDLADWRAREDRTALAGRHGEIDPEMRERLRKLGYVE